MPKNVFVLGDQEMAKVIDSLNRGSSKYTFDFHSYDELAWKNKKDTYKAISELIKETNPDILLVSTQYPDLFSLLEGERKSNSAIMALTESDATLERAPDGANIVYTRHGFIQPIEEQLDEMFP